MLWIWIGFILFVLLLLALDLGVFHRKAHVVEVKEALAWSAVWIAIALLFSVFVYYGYERSWMGLGTRPDPVDGQVNDGSRAVVKYLTGYVVEKSLSVDNIFVIAMIFAFFAVPAMYQHRVLFWGIIGALVMRGMMIGIGAALIARFQWILYVFGAFLIITAVKMLLIKTDHTQPGDNIIVRLARRWLPVTDQIEGQKLMVRGEGGRHFFTPLMLSLIMVETTDLIFAVDSIPAIFAITADPFLVFTSNVFAILGLRSLYFALAGMMDKFRYLKVSLAIVLAVVGVKMLTHSWLKALLGAGFNFYLLGVVLLILGGGVVLSLLADRWAKSRQDGRVAGSGVRT
ncbi:MAG TPA: TerC family protein [Tepidisphaeraceae bacterium]|jgi:tellurite resistance protein TerC